MNTTAGLEAEDFDTLDNILDDLRERFEETPQWEFCEGFMAALVCCRRAIPDAEWLPMLLGVDEGEEGGPALFTEWGRDELLGRSVVLSSHFGPMSALPGADFSAGGNRPMGRDSRGAAVPWPPHRPVGRSQSSGGCHGKILDFCVCAQGRIFVGSSYRFLSWSAYIGTQI